MGNQPEHDNMTLRTTLMALKNRGGDGNNSRSTLNANCYAPTKEGGR